MKISTIFFALGATFLASSCMSNSTNNSSLEGQWSIEQVNQKSISNFEKAPFIGFNTADNKYYGSSSCNLIHGIYKQANSHLEFNPIGSTMMLCQNMQLERDILKALSEVKSYNISNDTLYLLDQNNKQLLMLKRTDEFKNK